MKYGNNKKKMYAFINSDRCSNLLNATQADEEFTFVTVSGPEFGRSEVESRLNVTKGKFHTLECVATTQGEQAYTLFSIRGKTPCYLNEDIF